VDPDGQPSQLDLADRVDPLVVMVGGGVAPLMDRWRIAAIVCTTIDSRAL
jgi:hypothetical protein